jgi:hypothetical protein
MGLGNFFAGLGEKAKKLSSVFSGLTPVLQKIKISKKAALIVAAAFLVIIALLLVLAVVSRQRTGTTQADVSTAGATVLPRRETLPQDEFFLPYEPDFVPDVLLEREPKDGWTEEDARPFWTDPLDGNETLWRERIESEIDSLLEHVP